MVWVHRSKKTSGPVVETRTPLVINKKVSHKKLSGKELETSSDNEHSTQCPDKKPSTVSSASVMHVKHLRSDDDDYNLWLSTIARGQGVYQQDLINRDILSTRPYQQRPLKFHHTDYTREKGHPTGLIESTLCGTDGTKEVDFFWITFVYRDEKTKYNKTYCDNGDDTFCCLILCMLETPLHFSTTKYIGVTVLTETSSKIKFWNTCTQTVQNPES